MLKDHLTRKYISYLLILLLTGIMIHGCYRVYYFPVEVEDVTLSPVYRLQIQNNTSQVLMFIPSEKYRSHLPEKEIAIGESFTSVIQVKRFKVGQTLSNEVVAGPYIAWFQGYEIDQTTAEATPKTLNVELTDQMLSKTKWFRKGPDKP
jgi:hypothetical protein